MKTNKQLLLLTEKCKQEVKETQPLTSNISLLTEYSPSDSAWDKHRGEVDDVSEIYSSDLEFERYSQRMSDCSGELKFGWSEADVDGVQKFKLKEARFCRVRYCPVCQWRRSLMWRARFFEFLPKMFDEHPKARWVFLTLTVRNCDVKDLGGTLTLMGEAWNRLRKRELFKNVLGWVRTTEVTRSNAGEAHPHYHAVLMVKQEWFTGRGYVKHEKWVDIWQKCLKANYRPSVHIKTVTDKKKKKKAGESSSGLERAILETLKYSVKPSDMTENKDWFLEMCRQTHKRRFVATGGFFKNALKLDTETNEALALAGNEADEKEVGERISFKWGSEFRHYYRNSK
tara:strand:- start:291 stop:1316 length:1026 start_codon:yes stop_codon:yes gene_type:complete